MTAVAGLRVGGLRGRGVPGGGGIRGGARGRADGGGAAGRVGLRALRVVLRGGAGDTMTLCSMTPN